jgi:hypothetical protein
MISLDTLRAVILPGQPITWGTRNAPSQLVFFSLRNGVVAPSGQEFALGAVVGAVDHDGVLGDAQFVEDVEQLPHVLFVVDHGVVIGDCQRPAWPRLSGLVWVRKCMWVVFIHTKNGVPEAC